LVSRIDSTSMARTRRSRGSNGHASAHRLAARILDPFSPGTPDKFPDGAAQATLALRIKDRVTINTDANGDAIQQIFGSLTDYRRPANTPLATPLTWGAASDSKATTALADERMYRIVSVGVEFISTEAVDTAKGMGYVINTATPVNQDDFYDGLMFKPAEGFRAALTPLGPAARTFVVVGDASSSDWSILSVMLKGCSASTTVGYLQVVWNLEVVAGADTVAAYASSAPAAHSPSLLSALANGAASLHPVKAALWGNMIGSVAGSLGTFFGIRAINRALVARYVPFNQ